MKHFLITLMIAICAVFSLGAFAEPSLDDALNDLKTYELSKSRLSQTVIDAAVRTAHGNPQASAELAGKLSAVLNETQSVDAKRYICRGLGELGDAAAVPALAAHLSNNDMYDLAAWALRQIPGPEATAALISAVDTLAGRQKLEAIQSLGAKGGPEAIQKLTAIATATASDDEANAAIDALSMTADLNAASALIGLQMSATPTRAPAVFAARLEIAQRLNDAGEANAAKRFFSEVYQDAAAPSHVKAGALNGVVKTDPDNASAALVQALEGEDPELKRTAAKCIRLLSGADVLATFSALMAKVDDDTKRQVLQALTDRGEKVGDLALKTAQTTENETLKLVAIASLGKAGNADALDYLLGLAVDTSNDLGRAARVSLASLPADVDAEVFSRIAAADEKQADLLLRTLVERKANAVAPQLLELATAKDEAKSKALFGALEDLATPEQFEQILALLNTHEGDFIRSVEKVLIALGQRLDAPSKKLLVAANASGEKANNLSAVKVIAGIGQMNGENAYRKALVAALDSTDEEIRAISVRALGEWPNRQPLESLLIAADKAKAAQRDDLNDAILNLVAKSQVLVAPPNGSNYELTHMDYVVDGPKPMGPQEAMQIVQGIAKSTVNDGLRKKVLSALSKITLPEALKLAEDFAKRPELKAEAHNAMLNLAKSLMGAERDAATAALNEIISGSENQALKDQVQALLKQTEGLGDYIMAWRVSGPYAVDDPGHKVPFVDIMPTTLPDSRPFVLELLDTLGGFVRRAYLATNIKVDTASEAILELGSDDGVIVWLNGKKVYEFPEGRELIPGDDKIPLSLIAGDNILKIVVHQKASYWHACARLTNAEGKALEGVSVSLPEPGTY